MRPDAAGSARPVVAGPSGGVRYAGVSRRWAWVHFKFLAPVEEWKSGWKVPGLDGGPAVSALPLISCFSVIFQRLVGCLGDGPIPGRVGKADFAAGADGHGEPWPVPDR